MELGFGQEKLKVWTLFISSAKVIEFLLLPNYSLGFKSNASVLNSLTSYTGVIMATNGKAGDGHRHGAVRERSQTYNPKTEQYVKRDTTTGRFMDVKKDGTPFKGVRKEK